MGWWWWRRERPVVGRGREGVEIASREGFMWRRRGGGPSLMNMLTAIAFLWGSHLGKRTDNVPNSLAVFQAA